MYVQMVVNENFLWLCKLTCGLNLLPETIPMWQFILYFYENQVPLLTVSDFQEFLNLLFFSTSDFQLIMIIYLGFNLAIIDLSRVHFKLHSIWSSNFHSSLNSKLLLEWEQFSIFDSTMQLIECWWNDVRNGWDEFSKFQSKDRLHGWVDLCFIWMDHIWDLVVGELSSTSKKKKEFEIKKSSDKVSKLDFVRDETRRGWVPLYYKCTEKVTLFEWSFW